MNKIKQDRILWYVLLFVTLVLPLFFGKLVNSEQTWTLGEKVQVILIQAIAVVGAKLMFQCFSQNRLAVFLGAVLYLTSPYRVDLCYVQADLALSMVWALVPLYLYGLMKGREKGAKAIGYIVFSAVVVAGIGYGSSVMFCIMAALTVLVILVFRSPGLLLVPVGGMVLWIPGNLWFFRYLFTDGPHEVTFPIKNITPEGYSFLDFLTSYRYLDGKPGLGLGLLLAAVIYAYVRFVCGRGRLNQERKLFGVVGGLSLFLATRYFPWEMVQRVGSWALKFVSMVETPALFTGLAALLLPIMFMTAAEEFGADA